LPDFDESESEYDDEDDDEEEPPNKDQMILGSTYKLIQNIKLCGGCFKQ
jgi:hypothetical protein